MGHSPVWRAIVVGILRPLLFLFLKRDWRNRDNVPREGGAIIAANHLSWADPLALAHFVYTAGRFPCYLAKDSVFKSRVLGHILRRTGQIPVYRERSDAALALRDAERGLRAGECLMFYPEGTCTRDPNLWPMTGKTGAARLALTTGAPVIPVAHWGAQELWPYGTKDLRLFPRKTMHVAAGPPVDLSKYADRPLDAATLEAATADIMRAITDLLAGLRGEEPPAKPYDMREARRAERAAKAEVARASGAEGDHPAPSGNDGDGGDADTADAGSADAGATATETGKTDAGKTDAGKTDAGKTDAGKTDATDTDEEARTS